MRVLVFLLWFGFVAYVHGESHFTFSNPRGPHSVGLRVVQQYDLSRGYKPTFDIATGTPTQGERARPIQTLIWYPAQSGGTPTTYADYLRTETTEVAFTMSEAQLVESLGQLNQQRTLQVGPARVKLAMEQPMWARKNAPTKQGKFPVVIYAPGGGGAASENADLCEYLASHGYLVIASRNLGAHAMGLKPGLEDLEATTGDIEFLVGYAHTLPQANTDQIAVVGFSWGGIANVFAAARDNRITALVCLDGSIRYWPKLIAEAKVVTPERITVPMLFAGEPTASIENLLREGDDLSGSFLNQLVYSDFYFMNMAPMVHQDFNSESLRFKRDSAYQEFSREEASLAHSWVARYVRHFLDAYLKKADSSVAFLNAKPVANGAPQHLFTVEARPASTTPSTLLSLAEHLSKVGYDKALEVYRSMQKRKPGFQLSERDMNRWAYQMLGAGKVKAAIEIFKLEGLSYPDSWNAFDSLAEGYEADKDTAEAIRHYQRSLELNPKNDHAVEQLKTLRAVPGAAALKNP